MVPFSLSIWYHFLSQYGTIFFANSNSIENQVYYYVSSKQLFFLFKMCIPFFFAKKEARKRLYVGSYAAMVSSARPITPTACQAGDFLRMTRNMLSAPRREGLRPVDAGSRFSENTQCHRNNGSRYPINKTRAKEP